MKISRGRSSEDWELGKDLASTFTHRLRASAIDPLDNEEEVAIYGEKNECKILCKMTFSAAHI